MSFQFTRVQDGKKQRPSTLRDALGIGADARETWLFVSPHDDDLVIGCGLLTDRGACAGIGRPSGAGWGGRMIRNRWGRVPAAAGGRVRGPVWLGT